MKTNHTKDEQEPSYHTGYGSYKVNDDPMAFATSFGGSTTTTSGTANTKDEHSDVEATVQEFQDFFADAFQTSDLPSELEKACMTWLHKKRTSLQEQHEQRERELVTAFGGCRKCYGKGYGTQTLYARGRGESDMGQEDVVVDEKLPTMVFCKCERGKQLEELIQAEKREVVEETREEVVKEILEHEVLGKDEHGDVYESYVHGCYIREALTPPDKEKLNTDCHSDTILTCMPPKYKCSTCGRVEDEAF